MNTLFEIKKFHLIVCGEVLVYGKRENMFGNLWQRTKKVASTYTYTFIAVMFLNQLVFFGFCLNPICLVAAMPHVLFITVAVGSWLNKESKWGAGKETLSNTSPSSRWEKQNAFAIVPKPENAPANDKTRTSPNANKEEFVQQEIIEIFRSIGGDSLPPTRKLSDEKIIKISNEVMTAFKKVAKQRGEEISFEYLLNITIKFFGVYENFSEITYSHHLKYEIDKYLKEGLREDYNINIFKLGESTLSGRKLSIKNYAHERKIPHIIHFTQAKNLPSIMKHGLRSVKNMEEVGITSQKNDQHRWDERLHGLSVSIAFPNEKMFYKYRKVNTGAEWVVLIIPQSVLWEKDCAFFKHNAADSRVCKLPLEELKTMDAFQGMYDDKLTSKSGEILSRSSQGLASFETTDVQAEILVFDTITPKEIIGVFFENEAVRDMYRPISGDCPFVISNKSTDFFSSRSHNKK